MQIKTKVKHTSCLTYTVPCLIFPKMCFSGADKQPGVFWGAVSTALSEDGQSKLPSMEDKKVQDLATVMFYFFIICIILLVVYLVCSILLIWGAAKVSKITDIFLQWNLDEKSCFMVLFHEWKNPFNFSSQNISIECYSL